MRVRKRNKPCGFVLFGNRTLSTPLGRECTKNEKKNILVVERRIKGSIYDG